MRQKTHYNWNNSFVKCGEESYCAYVNNKCLNPDHMSTRQYEKHFKSKASLRTNSRFKKLLNHYLPGDNIIESIIEQTRFFKKNETELVVKLWEENWMAGTWNEAISKADEILAEREYHALVKILLNYVRLFIHNEAKYATQDYVKAIMLQDYIGEEFTQQHYETLTRPWLAAKRGAQAHKWSYKNRNLSIETVEITETLKSVAAEIGETREINNLEEYSEPEFTQEEQNNNVEQFAVTETVPHYWNQEKLIPNTQVSDDYNVETRNIEDFEHEENRSHVLISGSEEFFEEENSANDFLGQTQDYSELPKMLKTPHAVQNIITDIDSETQLRPYHSSDFSEKLRDGLQTISSSGTKVIENVKNYLGFNNFEEQHEQKVETDNLENDSYDFFAEQTFSPVQEEQELIETVETHSAEETVETKIAQMPEHLQDFMKTIYLK